MCHFSFHWADPVTHESAKAKKLFFFKIYLRFLYKKKISAWFENSKLDRIGNLLICSSLICSLLIRLNCSDQMSDCERLAQIAQDKWATVSESLRLNERQWANRWGRSWQKSNCEIFPQFAHDKWANERITCFFLANRSFALLLTKTSDSLNKIWLKSYFFPFFGLSFVSLKKKIAICSFPLF